MRCIPWLLGLAALMAMACVVHAAPAAGGDILQLGFRMGHRCILHAGGAVDCVSESPYLGGSLGNDPAYRPVRMIAHGATQLSLGGFASCAIVAGALDCWKGLPATGKKTAAPERLIASGVTDVSVGDDHACAVANGAALCWGRNFEGAVGHSNYQDDRLGTAQSTPWRVIAKVATRVAAGGDFSCAIAGGALWCWGNTRLVSDPQVMDYPGETPLRVFAHGVSAVAAGSQHACAIVEGALWCWGDNSRGQVGLGYAAEHARHAPTTPAYDPQRRGTFPDGEQTCWWQDWQTVQCRTTHPVKIIDHGVTAVYADGEETCALVDAALWCWGYNWAGQLGIPSDKQNVLKPTLAIAGGVASAAVTRQRTCAVMTDGTLRCTVPCTHDVNHCPATPGFVAGDPNDMSGIEARVGVWRGSIGGAKVMVCLERPDTLNDSMYYYLRHRFSIALNANASDASGATWNEGPPDNRSPDWSKPVAVWTLQAPVGDRMQGTWAAADGSRNAPIVLARVAPAATQLGSGCDAVDESASGSVFNAPRVASQKLDVRESGGFRYTSALDGQVSMTEIPDTLPHAARINAATRAWFASQIAGYYDCAFSNFDRKPDSSYSETSDVELLAPPWLVTRESYSAFCGGAHPASGTTYTVWNLDTGKAVEPWDFIKDSHWDFINKVYHCDDPGECERMPPPGLKAILAERFKHDSAGDGDCEDSLEAWPGYTLHPAKDGLVFSTNFAFVAYACNDDIKLPWKTLAPFLTRQGKALMRDLQQSR